MNEKELAVRLVRNTVATQRNQPEGYTEANRDSEVRAFGNAAIANSLELLGKHAIVADVQPTLGQGGIGFAYRIRPELPDNSGTDGEFSLTLDFLLVLRFLLFWRESFLNGDEPE